MRAQPRKKYKVSALRDSLLPFYFYVTFPTIYEVSYGDLDDKRNCVFCTTYRDCFVYFILFYFPNGILRKQKSRNLPIFFPLPTTYNSPTTRSHSGRPVSLNFYVTALFANSHVECIAKSAEQNGNENIPKCHTSLRLFENLFDNRYL